jgi:hypothetical protein
MTVEADASRLNSKAARILPKTVAATWEVHQLQDILPTASRASGYSEKPVTQKRSSHTCLIIEILAWIKNSSLIYLWAVDVWGRWIGRCGGTRKRRRSVWSVPLLQEVVRYAIEQYFYKIKIIAYLKIFTCIIEMMYCIHSSWRRNILLIWSSRLWRGWLDKELELERHGLTKSTAWAKWPTGARRREEKETPVSKSRLYSSIN